MFIESLKISKVHSDLHCARSHKKGERKKKEEKIQLGLKTGQYPRCMQWMELQRTADIY